VLAIDQQSSIMAEFHQFIGIYFRRVFHICLFPERGDVRMVTRHSITFPEECFHFLIVVHLGICAQQHREAVFKFYTIFGHCRRMGPNSR
jgi:hypothetical protein